jgi:hypothetical protein
MSNRLNESRRNVHERVEELRSNLGLFSFGGGIASAGTGAQGAFSLQLDVRPGGIVEWLVEKEGAGAFAVAMQTMAQSSGGRGVWAVVDTFGEFYAPALTGWGIDTKNILVLRPATLQETCWSIEQCLRCPGVRATWAWVDHRVHARVLRRWQMAAEVGGGAGLLFRPLSAQHEPVWADLRLLVTPRAGGQEETRRVNVDVLYRRGGLGGIAQVWEINHAAGHVRLVPDLANPAPATRAARA